MPPVSTRERPGRAFPLTGSGCRGGWAFFSDEDDSTATAAEDAGAFAKL